MQAVARAMTCERQLFGEALTNQSQHGHLVVSPFDPLAAGGGQAQIANVVAVATGIRHRKTSSSGRSEIAASWRRNQWFAPKARRSASTRSTRSQGKKPFSGVRPKWP